MQRRLVGVQYTKGKGTTYETQYQYTQRIRRAGRRSLAFRAVAWGYVDSQGGIPSRQAMKSAMCAHGPLAVAVDATDTFQAYAGGVFNENDQSTINHAITWLAGMTRAAPG